MKDRRGAGTHPTPRVVIVGAGIAGLCMAIRLLQAGISTFTVLEKSDRVGGTWRENTYPGSGCDIPSHLYCFSFEPNPGFSRKYSEQPEILRYLDHCATKYGVLPRVRFGTEVERATFDETRGEWTVRAKGGEEFVADVLLSGTGQLNRPFTPHVEGLPEFQGARFHSAAYRHDSVVRGKCVAVVGNGASAVQLVPRLARVAGKLSVFQRTPNWIVPRGDHTYGALARWAFQRVPGVLSLYRGLTYVTHEARFLGLQRDSLIGKRVEQASLRFLESQVLAPELRRKLTPTYPIGCRRVLISDDFYPALTKPGVELVTDPIERFTKDGIRTKDGVSRPFDVVVFATGFESTGFLAPMEVRGRSGQLLSDAWRDGAEAYLGVAMSGFPSLFFLYGPNTNLGHNSIIFMIECQVSYVLQCIERWRGAGSTLEVRRDAMVRYNGRLEADLEKTAWGQGCTSWYKTASGKVTNNWSGFTTEYWWRTRRPDFEDFEERTRTGTERSESSV